MSSHRHGLGHDGYAGIVLILEICTRVMGTKPLSVSKAEQAQSRVPQVIATLMMLVILVFQVNRILTASGGYNVTDNESVAEKLA